MMQRYARFLMTLVAVVMLAACSRTPDAEAVRTAVTRGLDASFTEPLLEIRSMRRLGSAPLADDADGAARRIVYYNALFVLERPYTFGDWESLNPAALANLLGATEKGLEGIRTRGNAAGDELKVRGSVTFRRSADGWTPMNFVAPPVGSGPLADDSGSPAAARSLVNQILNLFEHPPAAHSQSQAIITEELRETLRQITLRLERIQRSFLAAGGPEGGEYDLVARTIANFANTHGVPAASAVTQGSIENVTLLGNGSATVALIQNDIAGMAFNGSRLFHERGAQPQLRALGSLFPEPVHVVVRANDGPASVAELRGKRVDLGLPDSGSRITALAVLRAYGLTEADLAEATALGPAAAARALQAGEIDAFISVINAPARLIQRLSADAAIRLLPIDAAMLPALTADDSSLVPVTLPPGTYPGQTTPLATVAVAALLVGRDDMADADVTTLLRAVYERIDFVAAGSAAGALISLDRARTGLTLPLHPQAQAFFEAQLKKRDEESPASPSAAGDAPAAAPPAVPAAAPGAAPEPAAAAPSATGASVEVGSASDAIPGVSPDTAATQAPAAPAAPTPAGSPAAS